MRVAYFDCFSGISGNMVLGALIDLGLPPEKLEKGLKKIPLGEYELKIFREKRAEISGVRIKVNLLNQEEKHRSFFEIKELIEKSYLEKEEKTLSIRIFHHLAEAESKIHQKDISQIHFHEVGAADSIIDIVGTAIGINYLKIDQVYASKIPLGSGFVRCSHGTLPLPSPASLELLRGIPIYGSSEERELVTPTGAAILTSLARNFGPLPLLRIDKIGYGVGDEIGGEIPNLLRIVLGEEEREILERDRVLVIEANIDNMNPEFYDYLMERLLEEGALDVSLSPIQMKKNRPGTLLKVISPKHKSPDLIRLIFQESTTTGIRLYEAERYKLKRRVEEVETNYSKIPVKVSSDLEKDTHLTPEYEVCKAIAKEKGIPLKEVYRVIANWLTGERKITIFKK